jgi:hypothetical protein
LYAKKTPKGTVLSASGFRGSSSCRRDTDRASTVQLKSRGPGARAPSAIRRRRIKGPVPRPRLGARGHALGKTSGRWRGALRGRAPGPPRRCRSPTRWPRARRDPARQRHAGTRRAAGGGAAPLAAVRKRAPVRVPGFNAPLFFGVRAAVARRRPQCETSPRGDAAGMAGWGLLNPTADLCALSAGLSASG